MTESLRVFVYGSLLRQGEHHAYLAGARPLGPARTVARFRLVRCGRYPALVPGGATAVRGELYEVSAQLLRSLDEFEECPEVYQRERIPLQDAGWAWGYVRSASAVQGCTVLHGSSWPTGD